MLHCVLKMEGPRRPSVSKWCLSSGKYSARKVRNLPWEPEASCAQPALGRQVWGVK